MTSSSPSVAPLPGVATAPVDGTAGSGRRPVVRRRLALRLIAIAICCRTTPLRAQTPRADPPIAFTHVAVVDVEHGRVLADQTVVIAGNRIREVADAGGVAIPTGARVVDGRGRYLMPGLWDMHIHAVRMGRAAWMFPLLLRFGITGIRDTGSPVDSLLYYRAAVLDGRVIGPRVVGTGPILDGPNGDFPDVSRIIASPQDGRRVVDSLADAGVNFIKTYNRLTRDDFLAMADEARRRGIPILGHVPWAMNALEASDSGMATIEHMTRVPELCLTAESNRALDSLWRARRHDGMPRDSLERLRVEFARLAQAAIDESLCERVGAHFARNGTWQDPTLERDLHWGHAFLTSDTVDADPYLRYVPPAVVAFWRHWADSAAADPVAGLVYDAGYPAKARVLAALHRAGEGVLGGTDTDGNDSNIYGIPGLALHHEIEAFVRDVGLTPAEALRAATINPAKFLHATDSLGTVAAGKVADLVLLQANPLEDVRNAREVAGVVANGRYLDSAALDAMLEASRRRMTDRSASRR